MNTLSVPAIVEEARIKGRRNRARFRKGAERLLSILRLRDEAPKLDLEKVWQCVPEDTVVVEYALATCAPLTGLVTIVSSRKGVIDGFWKPLSSKEVTQNITNLLECRRADVYIVARYRLLVCCEPGCCAC